VSHEGIIVIDETTSMEGPRQVLYPLITGLSRCHKGSRRLTKAFLRFSDFEGKKLAESTLPSATRSPL